jgi:hypothetical protein
VKKDIDMDMNIGAEADIDIVIHIDMGIGHGQRTPGMDVDTRIVQAFASFNAE